MKLVAADVNFRSCKRQREQQWEGSQVARMKLEAVGWSYGRIINAYKCN
jgi:hypothetical protein